MNLRDAFGFGLPNAKRGKPGRANIRKGSGAFRLNPPGNPANTSLVTRSGLASAKRTANNPPMDFYRDRRLSKAETVKNLSHKPDRMSIQIHPVAIERFSSTMTRLVDGEHPVRLRRGRHDRHPLTRRAEPTMCQKKRPTRTQLQHIGIATRPRKTTNRNSRSQPRPHHLNSPDSPHTKPPTVNEDRKEKDQPTQVCPATSTLHDNTPEAAR